MPDLEQKITNKTAKLGVVGLCYVGLPLAIAFSEANFPVFGLDTQQPKVDSVNRGESYIADVSSKTISKVVSNGLLKATTNQGILREMDAIVICVPTPLSKTKEPDLSYVVKTSEEISQNLQPHQLIIMESTTYPGTTNEVILPILERSGLKATTDFYLAYSPERVDPGNRKYNIQNTPKVVAGINPESTRLSVLLYSQVAEKVIPVSCPAVAEMTKIFENVFRSVNIALVNELTQLCQKIGISAWEVIDAASSKPFGYMPFYPGPGVGGHCIPLDPYYLASKAREYGFHTRFIELAAEINEQMPDYITLRIMEALNKQQKSLSGANILVLGAAYKKDLGDTRESPSLILIKLLQEKGANVSYNDPYVSEITISGNTLTSVDINAKGLYAADCLVIATDHSFYDYQFIANNTKLVFDTRGCTRGLDNTNIVRL